MGNQWCGICSSYSDHDTAHHATDGGAAVGDVVPVTYEHREYQAKVEEVRGRRMRVSFPVGRRTHTIWVDHRPNGRS